MYGALESVAVLWRLRSYRDIIIIIIIIPGWTRFRWSVASCIAIQAAVFHVWCCGILNRTIALTSDAEHARWRTARACQAVYSSFPCSTRTPLWRRLVVTWQAVTAGNRWRTRQCWMNATHEHDGCWVWSRQAVNTPSLRQWASDRPVVHRLARWRRFGHCEWHIGRMWLSVTQYTRRWTK